MALNKRIKQLREYCQIPTAIKNKKVGEIQQTSFPPTEVVLLLNLGGNEVCCTSFKIKINKKIFMMKTLQIIIATVLNEVQQQTSFTHNFNFKNKTISMGIQQTSFTPTEVVLLLKLGGNEVQQTLCTHNFNFKNKTTSMGIQQTSFTPNFRNKTTSVANMYRVNNLITSLI
jgi:hypothetical protein